DYYCMIEHGRVCVF
nr:immunoglobulin light chain junction region [Macaca mulatta]